MKSVKTKITVKEALSLLNKQWIDEIILNGELYVCLTDMIEEDYNKILQKIDTIEIPNTSCNVYHLLGLKEPVEDNVFMGALNAALRVLK